LTARRPALHVLKNPLPSHHHRTEAENEEWAVLMAFCFLFEKKPKKSIYTAKET
jgi:hypothetical protein